MEQSELRGNDHTLQDLGFGPEEDEEISGLFDLVACTHLTEGGKGEVENRWGKWMKSFSVSSAIVGIC